MLQMKIFKLQTPCWRDGATKVHRCFGEDRELNKDAAAAAAALIIMKLSVMILQLACGLQIHSSVVFFSPAAHRRTLPVFA